MKKQSLGLCIITKDEAANIRRLLESVVEHVDHVYLTDTGSSDDTIKIAKQTCKRFKTPIIVNEIKWPNDFSKARNINFKQAKTDWILWLDADDTVENPEYLKVILDRASSKKATGIALTYRYHVDQHNIDKASHPKLRIVKNGLYHWASNAPIHENLFINDDAQNQDVQVLFRESKVRHWKDTDGFVKSGERNLKMLQELYNKEKRKKIRDNRTVFLLGREHHNQWKISGEKKNREEATKFLHDYIDHEQKGGERMTAASLLFDIYFLTGRFNECRDMAYEAVKSYSSHPLGYILVAKYYAQQENYEEVVKWIDQSKNRTIDELDPTVQAPKGLLKDAAMLLAEAHLELKNWDQARANLKYYLRICEEGEKEQLEQRLDVVDKEERADKIIQAFVRLSSTAIQQDQLEELQHVLNIVPGGIRHRESVLKLQRRVGLLKTHAKGSVAIFCGVGFEEWHEGTLNKGMGGSETAVVELAKRFGKAGYKVTVYGSVEEDKVFGNVTYTNAQKINFADHFDIFISWRNPLIVDKYNVWAEKKYLWLHDVPSPYDYSPQIYNSYDKIIVLSKFHKTFLPSVPDEKFYISSNGIDVDTIRSVAATVERIPKRVIYASSADRGLENLLDCVEEARKEIGYFEVAWAYGWNTFDALRGNDSQAMKWKEMMIERMNKLGIIQLGRLGKKELYKEYFKSSVWAYPTTFDEINCIVAQEAQASGLYPISTGHGALEEMQLFGIKTGPYSKEGFTRALIDGISASQYEVFDYQLARDKFDWQVTANNWMNDLFYGVEFEQHNPLVSIVCITIRPGIFRILRETVEQQTYKNIELIVVDGRYEERKDEVAEYMKDFEFPFIHLPDPLRDKEKYHYGLHHADMAALSAVRGELTVFLQDFILMPSDGVEKYVELYKVYPDKLLTGVDTRNRIEISKNVSTKLGKSLPRSIDIAEGDDYKVGVEEFRSPRVRIGRAKRESGDPFEWELNWAAAPTKILREMGGWDPDWDSKFGYDNTVFALKYIYEGGSIIVDETNLATALSHWQLFGDNDSEGVPDRNKKTNDNRYWSFARYLSQRNVDARIKLVTPTYPKEIQEKLDNWHKQI